MKLIAETAWHHEGDFTFMKNLVSKIAENTNTDIIKMHITLDFDEYMDQSHDLYKKLKSMLFTESQWKEIISIPRKNNKQIMLLLNDTSAIEFGLSLDPEYIEIHSVCLNDIFILQKIKSNIKANTKIVLGVGGTNIDEIINAKNYLEHQNLIIMFGFQNYPTVYEDVNLNKVRKLMSQFKDFEFGYADHTSWNSEYNELITLLGAASGMQYVEKHVTTHLGDNRIDFHAAISINMFNELHNKLQILDKLNGNGSLEMNSSEISYSQFGPMKKAAKLITNVSKGDTFNINMIKFIRTNQISDMSQLDVLNSFGSKIECDLKMGTLLMKKHFSILT